MTATQTHELVAKARAKRVSTLKKRISFHELSISPSLLKKEMTLRANAELRLDIQSSQPTSNNRLVRFAQNAYFRPLNAYRNGTIRKNKALLAKGWFDHGIKLEKTSTANALSILKAELARIS